MAWVTKELIQDELSYSISATTKPTTEATTAIIASIEATCRGVLNSLKVDASSIDETGTPECFLIVQQWALFGVCARVIASAGGLIRSSTGKEKDYWQKFNQTWGAIKESPSMLGDDAPFYTSDENIISPDGLVSTDSDYDAPEFTIGMEF